MNSKKRVLRLAVLSWSALAAVATAQVPDLPAIPAGLPDDARQSLEQKSRPVALAREALIRDGNQHNKQCVGIERGSSREADCFRSVAQLKARSQSLAGSIDDLRASVAAAVAAEKRRLQQSDDELTARIERDLAAIRAFGFDRRADDFSEWESLAASAQNDFENTIKGELVSLET